MLEPGTVLQGRYRVVRQLARGGMGTVYEALDERLEATVALKETSFEDEELRKQFEREARLLARLQHPALPRVSDHFTEGAGQFLVMQFVPGSDLEEMRREQGGAFPAPRVLEWADQLLDALDYLHTQEPPVIHRDIKPQNLKLGQRGQVVLLDFGLAKGYTSLTAPLAPALSVVGYTPAYAPLEQIQGTGTDARSDLYSLAASLYHLMTGVVPPNALARADAVLNGEPDPLRRADEISPQVSSDVADVLRQAMSLRRDQRLSMASAMRRALREADKTPRAQEARVVTASTVIMSPQPTDPERQQGETVRAEPAPAPDTGARREVAETSARHEIGEPVPRPAHDAVAGTRADLHATPASLATNDSLRADSTPTAARGSSATVAARRRSRNALLLGGLAALILLVLVGGGVAVYKFVQQGGGESGGGAQLRVLKGHAQAVRAVSVAPDGKTFASAGMDGKVIVWDAATGETKQTIEESGKTVVGVAFSPDGRTLAASMYGGDGKSAVAFYDAASGKEESRPTLKGSADDLIGSIAFSPDGARLFAALGSHVAVWRVEDGELELAFDDGANPVFAVSRDGAVAALANSNDNDVKLYDTHTGLELRTLAGHTKGILSLAFSPSGQTLASGSFDDTARLWEAATGGPLQVLKGDETEEVASVAFAPSGQTVATGSDKTVRLWDARKGAQKQTYNVGENGAANALAFSRDGTTLVCGTDSGAVLILPVNQ